MLSYPIQRILLLRRHLLLLRLDEVLLLRDSYSLVSTISDYKQSTLVIESTNHQLLLWLGRDQPSDQALEELVDSHLPSKFSNEFLYHHR